MSVVGIAGQYGWDFDASSSEDIQAQLRPFSWLRPAYHNDVLKEGRCRICLQINFHALFQQLLSETTFRWRGNDIQLAYGIRLGSIARVKSEMSCPFCQLVASIYRSKIVGVSETNDEFDVWLSNTATTSAGQASLQTHTTRQGPIIVQLEISIRPGPFQGSLSCAAEQSVLTFKIQQYVDEHQALGPQLSNSIRRGRVEYWRLIKWIDACQEADSYRSRAGDENDSVDFHERLQLYSRVIDLHRRRIVRAPKNCRYVALSYVWGGRNHLQLRIDNEKKFTQDGSIQFEAFPRTIRDTIELCRELGERYLWCDSMCILQNSQEKHVEIKSMEAIYRGAVLSIVAAAGNHADFGIPGISAGPFRFQEHRTYLHEEVEKVYDSTTRKVIEAASLVNVAQDFEASVDASVWNTRAWTYQERLLSRRLIFFTKDHIYFQCDHGRAQADCGLDPHDPTHIRYLRSHGTDRNERYRLQSKRKVNFSIYAQVVQEYTGRQLSFATDIENAFAGISKIISLLFGGSEVLFGVPLSSLAIGLLWNSKQSLANRRALIKDTPAPRMRRVAGRVTREEEMQTYAQNDDFPSWSWVGWIGAMEFREVKHLSERTISKVKWLDPLNKLKSLPEEHFGGRPTSDWTCIEDWVRQVTPANDIYYTQRGSDGQHWFCHPMEPFIHNPIPISRDTGTLYFKASFADLEVQQIQTGELAIYDSSGRQVGLVTMDDRSGDYKRLRNFDFVRLSQTTLKEGKDDPAWNPLRADYLGLPGGPAVNPSPNILGADRIFDTGYYDAKISWCLYNVLAVRVIGDTMKRIGIGKVHIHAFDAVAQLDKVVRLI